MWDAQQLYNTRFHQECQQFFQYFFVLFAEIILGSFFRAKCPSLPASPLGRGGIASAMTERASLFSKSIRTAICIGFCQSDTIAAPVIFRQRPCPLSHRCAMPQPGLRLPASASLSLASCWPLPQQLLSVSATGGGRRRCLPRGGFGIPESLTSSPEAPLQGELAAKQTERLYEGEPAPSRQA